MIANILAALLGLAALYVYVAVWLCDGTPEKPSRWCPLCRLTRLRRML